MLSIDRAGVGPLVPTTLSTQICSTSSALLAPHQNMIDSVDSSIVGTSSMVETAKERRRRQTRLAQRRYRAKKKEEQAAAVATADHEGMSSVQTSTSPTSLALQRQSPSTTEHAPTSTMPHMFSEADVQEARNFFENVAANSISAGGSSSSSSSMVPQPPPVASTPGMTQGTGSAEQFWEAYVSGNVLGTPAPSSIEEIPDTSALVSFGDMEALPNNLTFYQLDSDRSSSNVDSSSASESSGSSKTSGSPSSPPQPDETIVAAEDQAAKTNGHVGMAIIRNIMMSQPVINRGYRMLQMPQVDFLRAFLANAFALGYVYADLERCKKPSRMQLIWSKSSDQLKSTLPRNMLPTEEQLTQQDDYNLILDCLPWPSVRQKVIKLIRLGVFEADDFKKDLVCAGTGEGWMRASFRIHGVSADDDFAFNGEAAREITMDPESWECAEDWIRKYWFIVNKDIVRRTNFWRRIDGKPPIRLQLPVAEE